MRNYEKNKIFHKNIFSLIFLITFSFLPIIYSISGSDIVRQISEECNENENSLKFNIIMNSTAFLLYLNSKLLRNLDTIQSDLVGKNIGIERGKTFESIVKTNYPRSTIVYADSSLSLIISLLSGNAQALILDEPVAKYYSNKISEISCSNSNIQKENYGFAFSKNEININLIKYFNEYLSSIKQRGEYDNILNIWKGDFTSMQKIDKNLDGNNGVIKAAFNQNLPPMSYKDEQTGDMVGFEIDLLYRFAKIYGYKIELTTLTLNEQINNLINGNVDLIGGCISITDERSLIMDFSDPITEGGPLLVMKQQGNQQNKQPTITAVSKKIIIKDQLGNQKYDNKLSFPVNNLPDGQTRSGYCIFPQNLTEIYSFQCVIPNLTPDKPMVNGYTFGLITDIIEVNGNNLSSVYSYIPSHILGKNTDVIEHKGTMCPKMNVDLAGVDNLELNDNNELKLHFGIYRNKITMPTTSAKLFIIKNLKSCFSKCDESNILNLDSNTILARYSCSCSLIENSEYNSMYKYSDYIADFDNINFYYADNQNKIINMAIKNKKMTSNGISNLNNNTAKFPSDLKTLNTFVVSKLNNGRCIKGKFAFNAIGLLYKTITQNQSYVSYSPIYTDLNLKTPYDLDEAEIQIMIGINQKGTLVIKKDYYLNEKNNGEYLYLSSKDNVTIHYDKNCAINSNVDDEEEEEEEELRDEMSMPKWVIVFFVFLITGLIMAAIYLYIKRLETENEYVIKYEKASNKSNYDIDIKNETQNKAK